MHSSFLSSLALAWALLIAPAALAQYTRDTSANKKIDEAVNMHYLATDFDKAEGVLLGTVRACEDKCSPQTLARAWMYVGIIRGSGRNDISGAKEAFQSALALDPNVRLDAALATAETQAAFNEVAGSGPVTPAAPPPAQVPAEPEDVAAVPSGEGLFCTPDVPEIETRRPIPVECRTDEEATSMELRYQSFGSDTWKTLRMTKKGDAFRATIPCEATQIQGSFRVYVRAKDASGVAVGEWGSKAQPVEFVLVEQSAADPPAFDGEPPPERCPAKEECPPDFPGCDSGKPSGGNVDWGGACDNSSQCKAGLLCIDGTCETAPSCETSSDCPVGSCVNGKCAIDPDGPAEAGPYKKNWIGLHVAQDVAFVSANDVCSPEGQASQSFSCYYAGSTTDAFVDHPYPGVNIGSGTALGTTRVLLSYDRAFSSNLMAGVRLGYAFRGGPPANRDMEYVWNESRGEWESTVYEEGESFLPYHAEVRATYLFGRGLGSQGLRFYVHAGGGLAQVDAKVVVPVVDCGVVDPDPQKGNNYAACANGTIREDEAIDLAPPTADPRTDLDAWKKLGRGFITAGGGAMLGLGRSAALQLNVNLMYMLGSSGAVIEPSLGLNFGL